MYNLLAPGVVRIHLDTERRFSARIAAQIIDAMAASIEANPEMQAGVETALIASGEGTWWAHLLVLVGGTAAAVGGGVLAIQALATEIKEGRTPFSRGVSAGLEEGGGRAVTLCAADVEIRIEITQIMSYPPPVGEDRLTWASGATAGLENDWHDSTSDTFFRRDAGRSTEGIDARVTEEGEARRTEDPEPTPTSENVFDIDALPKAERRRAVRFVDPTKEREPSAFPITVPAKEPDVVSYHAAALYEGTFYRNAEGDFIRTVDPEGGQVFQLRGYPEHTQLPFLDSERVIVSGKPDYKGGIYPQYMLPSLKP